VHRAVVPHFHQAVLDPEVRAGRHDPAPRAGGLVGEHSWRQRRRKTGERGGAAKGRRGSGGGTLDLMATSVSEKPRGAASSKPTREIPACAPASPYFGGDCRRCPFGLGQTGCAVNLLFSGVLAPARSRLTLCSSARGGGRGILSNRPKIHLAHTRIKLQPAAWGGGFLSGRSKINSGTRG